MEQFLLLEVKMCGNCNPVIESSELVRKIARDLQVKVIPYRQAPAQASLIVNGCETGCVDESMDPRAVHIRGYYLNGSPCVGESELLTKAEKLLKDQIFGNQEKEGRLP
ncbi:hypothetical protein EQM14_10010 [Caproiciproducens sp. NJN-50]|uniref:hypothetical protein n=1 Tax=Acutalibacteraceae TaxID=3082771 RepID=UPI000FFE14F7|nr:MULTISPECIES: hypothetical protein [Acutalibacteraceae]QAT50080.1 hypothetical protein EQM14_10010 [Caproiciproducens sp. NJN-50]